MRYLLDTCVLLWCLEGNFKKLGPFREIIENEQTDIAISVISYWEIGVKQTLGKLETVPLRTLMQHVEKAGFLSINLSKEHVLQLENLPLIHNDPFDRLLIAQSITEQLILLTVDEKILSYPSLQGAHY